MDKNKEAAVKRVLSWASDYGLFAEDCLKIKNKLAAVVPFKFNRMQRYFWELELEDHAAGKPIRWLVLKIRQCGSSTYFAGRNFWKTVTSPNRSSIIVAHDSDLAAHIFSMQKFFFKNLPEAVRPMVKADNRQTLYFANPDPSATIGLESRIIVDTAANRHVGAGFTLQDVHLAEIGRYEEVTDIPVMMTSLMQAIPDIPDSSLIGESTAHGEGWFKDQWDRNPAYRKIFISYVAVEDYRLEKYDDFELSSVVESRYGDETEEAMYIENEIRKWYPEWNEDIPANVFAAQSEVKARLAWRRKTIDEKCQGDRKIFDQEYPITPEKAFMLSGDNVFDTVVLSQFAERLRSDPPKIRRYYFDQAAADNYRTDQAWWQKAFAQNNYGHLYVYAPAEPNRSYVIGADPSEGLSEGDDSAICVLSVPDLVEVAHWSRPLDPDHFGDILYCLGMMYNEALIGVERNSFGGAVIGRLAKDLHYPRIYWKEEDGTRIKPNDPSRWGWHSNIRTKPYMLGKLKAVIRDQHIRFNSLENVLEHKSFKKIEDKYFVIGEKGRKKSANRVIATGIAVMMSENIHRFPQKKPDKPERNSLKFFEEYISINYPGGSERWPISRW